MLFDSFALALVGGCVFYAANFARKTGTRIAVLEKAFEESGGGREHGDSLSHGEVVLEANELWESCRILGPRAAKLGVLVSVAHLFASVGSLSEVETLTFLGIGLLLGGSGYAYTRVSFRRNESRLRRVREKIRSSTRASES